MNTCELLDSAKAALGLPSDYALSKWLGVTRSMMSRYRCGKDHLGDEYALKIAEALKIHPGAVLAAIHAERSKRPAVKKAWEKIARQLGTAASVFFTVFLAIFLFSASPSPAQASAAQHVENVYYVNVGAKVTKGFSHEFFLPRHHRGAHRVARIRLVVLPRWLAPESTDFRLYR